jgi:tetratricopeptide (TPR) repeat protein
MTRLPRGARARTALVALATACALAAGCAPRRKAPAPPAKAPAATAPSAHVHPTESRRTLPEGAKAPLFRDLGDHHYAITTDSELAQRYFDQGLTLTYAFNHAEAVRSFREAARLDPDCAMCFWGEAYALGSNINAPMEASAVPEAWGALQKARGARGASERERALIAALAQRYAENPPADRSPLDRAYAAAMREVARSHPDDLDIQTLYAEAVMDTMPWNYHAADGSPKPEAAEIIAVLESVIARAPEHPGAIHYYIHAVEASSTPERAEAHADRLLGLVPGAGHLVHMPSHIYLRVGRYADASRANELAARADESYIAQCQAQGVYPAMYYSHNVHFLWASASFEGKSTVAIAAADKLVANLSPEGLAKYPFTEEFLPTDLYALARFGRWDEILARPAPDPRFGYATGVWHYVRGLALAGKGRLDEAGAEHRRVLEIAASKPMGELTFTSGSTPRKLLTIGAVDLGGRIASRRGDHGTAIALLKKAVSLQDALPYTEPPPWYFPEREALGDALLRAGRPKEAEAVYVEQLERTPRNGWSLYGLARSLRAQGRTEEAARVEDAFTVAWERADVPLTASVF